MLLHSVTISADASHHYLGELLHLADTRGRQNDTWCLDATEDEVIFRFAGYEDALVLRGRIRAQAVAQLMG